jgi:hypothetical protein
VRRTFVVTFDYSSLVLLELLARQNERSRQGHELYTRITSVFIVNGGLLPMPIRTLGRPRRS